MADRKARFLLEDAFRLVKSAEKAGVRDYRVDVSPDGSLSLVIGAAARVSTRPNSCDDLLN